MAKKIRDIYEKTKVDITIDAKENEAILKRAGVADLIELMVCENCKHFKDLYCQAKSDAKGGYLKVSYGDTCATFSEKPELLLDISFKDVYNKIKVIIKEFIDTKEENYEIITIWIIGTWMHDNFPTYPYLFINAMKGSGKTRLLKLIKELAWNGDMLASLSEAVLFRTTGTLCIDEFEGIGSKDKNNLRELLNTAYKKGGKVKRMRKKKTAEGEEQVVEEFDTFRPIVMANIAGLEEVLQDRCITIILERSNNPTVTRKIEDFSENTNIHQIKALLRGISVEKCKCIVPQKVYREWNIYIDTYTHTHTTTTTTPTYTPTPQNKLFDKIYATEINGRDLELTLPLLLVSEEIGILDEVIEIMKALVEHKKQEDVMEGRDIQLLDFVLRQDEKEYYKINELVTSFKRYINYEYEDERHHWLTNIWFGRALKRLNLVSLKRRLGAGVEVILNVEKANKKMQMFR